MKIEGLAKLPMPRGIHVGRRLWRVETPFVSIDRDKREAPSRYMMELERQPSWTNHPISHEIDLMVHVQDLPDCRITSLGEMPVFDVEIKIDVAKRIHIDRCLLRSVGYFQSVDFTLQNGRLTEWKPCDEQYLPPTIAQMKDTLPKDHFIVFKIRTEAYSVIIYDIPIPNNHLCQHCCRNVGTEPHPCPYKEEVKKDAISTCNCCAVCTRECADDV